MSEIYLFRSANNYKSTDLPFIKTNIRFDKVNFFVEII